MSNISTVYDKLIEIVGTDLFSDKNRLPDPYNLNGNPSSFLKLGWGLKFSPSGTGDIGIYNKHIEGREFSIVFTYKVAKLTTDSSALDTPTKLMAEDNNALSLRMLNADQLGIPDSVGKIEFNGNSGMEFLENDKVNYISTETSFIVDILEDL